MMYDDIQKVLIDKDRISARVKELGKEISEDYKGEDIIMVCILRGSCLFFADLCKEIPNYITMEFMSVSSYGAGTSSSGEVKINSDINNRIEGKNVVIVEDIIDTGYTLSFLKRILLQRHPKSLRICTLLDKPERREVALNGDYVGFSIPNEFVVGYGLDYDQLYRNYPHIGVLKPSVYEK